jgi:hypothetical protein
MGCKVRDNQICSPRGQQSVVITNPRFKRKKSREMPKTPETIQLHNEAEDEVDHAAQASKIDDRMGSSDLTGDRQNDPATVEQRTVAVTCSAGLQQRASPAHIEQAWGLIEQEISEAVEKVPFANVQSKQLHMMIVKAADESDETMQQERAARDADRVQERAARERADRVRVHQRDVGGNARRPRLRLAKQGRHDRRLEARNAELRALQTSVNSVLCQWTEWLWPLLFDKHNSSNAQAARQRGTEQKYVDAVMNALPKHRKYNDCQRRQLYVRCGRHYYAHTEHKPFKRRDKLERLLHTIIIMQVACVATRMSPRDALRESIVTGILRSMQSTLGSYIECTVGRKSGTQLGDTCAEESFKASYYGIWNMWHF